MKDKTLKMYFDLVDAIKGEPATCYGNESLRHEGKFKDASVNVEYFNYRQPWISLSLGFGEVYHFDVPNRRTYSEVGFLGASVSIAGDEVGRIGQGLVVFIGVDACDTEKDINYIVKKIVNLRIFSDAAGRFNFSVLDIGGQLLLVSQFTLLANTRKGRRPSFTEAAPVKIANHLFTECVRQARTTGLRVITGFFQQYMQVEIHNDGPVTIMLDSKNKLE